MSEPTTTVQLAPQFPALDTLRAVGALAVLTTHTSFQTGEYLGNGVWGTLLARLDVGVAIFFVLSGFLLSRPHLARARLKLEPPDVVRYYEKRALRILPVYLVTVAIALTYVPGNSPGDGGQWLSSLLLLDSYRLATLPHGLTHMWSISVELAFYCILPLIMMGIVRSRRLARRLVVVLGSMAAVSVVWHAWLASLIAPHVVGATGLWLPAYLTWFACGIALAWLHVEVQARPPGTLLLITRHFTLPGVAWVAVLGLMLLTATPLAGPILLTAGTEAQSLTKHVAYAMVGFILVGAGVFSPLTSRYVQVMSWRPLRHLGHISYSVFCIHLAVLSLTFELLGIEPFTGRGLLIWVVTVGLTWIAAEILYAVVEMPALRLKDRWRRVESTATRRKAPQDATTER